MTGPRTGRTWRLYALMGVLVFQGLSGLGGGPVMNPLEAATIFLQLLVPLGLIARVGWLRRRTPFSWAANVALAASLLRRSGPVGSIGAPGIVPPWGTDWGG